jgi:hypothetical protein
VRQGEQGLHLQPGASVIVYHHDMKHAFTSMKRAGTFAKLLSAYHLKQN